MENQFSKKIVTHNSMPASPIMEFAKSGTIQTTLSSLQLFESFQSPGADFLVHFGIETLVSCRKTKKSVKFLVLGFFIPENMFKSVWHVPSTPPLT
jgi:hypothetical protein